MRYLYFRLNQLFLFYIEMPYLAYIIIWLTYFNLTNTKLQDAVLGKRCWEISTFFLIIISFVPEKKYDTKYQRVWHPANDSLPLTEFCRYENLFDSYFWKLSIFLTCTYVQLVMKSKKNILSICYFETFLSYIWKYLFCNRSTNLQWKNYKNASYVYNNIPKIIPKFLHLHVST